MRLSPLALVFALACSDAPTPADAGTYGIHYPDHPDASAPEDPGTSGEVPYVPPWMYKKWLVDPGPESTP